MATLAVTLLISAVVAIVAVVLWLVFG